MTELEKMQRAKMYIDKMANGINPIDDVPADDSDIINNIRVSRCLFYVSDILGQVIQNGGNIGKKSKKPLKRDFYLSDEIRKTMSFDDIPLPISEIVKRLNYLADLETCHKLSYKRVVSWLIEIGAIKVTVAENGKERKSPTEQGEELGIFTETRMGYRGQYEVILYNKSAQQFIVDNLDAILENKGQNLNEKPDNNWQPWTAEYEECLIDLFNKNVPISEIAITLKRTDLAIESRLKKLGLIIR